MHKKAISKQLRILRINLFSHAAFSVTLLKRLRAMSLKTLRIKKHYNNKTPPLAINISLFEELIEFALKNAFLLTDALIKEIYKFVVCYYGSEYSLVSIILSIFEPWILCPCRGINKGFSVTNCYKIIIESFKC